MHQGIASKLQEAPIMFEASSPLNIRMYHVTGAEDLNDYQHEVLLVTLKDASVYVVDLAGAQYGYHEQPAMLVETYEKSRAGHILHSKIHEFGWQRLQTEKACITAGETWAGATRNYSEWFHQCLNQEVKDWQRLNMPLPAMLKANNDTEYRRNQLSFIQAVKAGLGDYKQWAAVRGHFEVEKIRIDHPPQHIATDSKAREPTYEEQCAELLANAGIHYHHLDMRGLGS